jgi:hypothetical protein
VVKADHYSVKYLLDQCLATIPQHQWVSKLMGFDYRVEYKPGAGNMMADALSRWEIGEEGQLAVVSAPSFKVFDDLRAKTEEVTTLWQLKKVQAGQRGGGGGKVEASGRTHNGRWQGLCVYGLTMSARHPDDDAWHGA